MMPETMCSPECCYGYAGISQLGEFSLAHVIEAGDHFREAGSRELAAGGDILEAGDPLSNLAGVIKGADEGRGSGLQLLHAHHAICGEALEAGGKGGAIRGGAHHDAELLADVFQHDLRVYESIHAEAWCCMNH